MKKLVLSFVALIAFAGGVLRAQDITGNWQGTLKVGKDLRIILQFSKDDGHLKAVMYSIDQTPQPFKASSASLDGTTVKFAVNLIGGTYEGKLSADGKTIDGTWTQGGTPLPFVLTRATKETAWEIPAPPPPPKLMAADADPSFDVATIKPNDSGATSMQGLTVNGRNFATKNSSLVDLIKFAYNVHPKQIVGAPEWADKDRYDVAAVPDAPGDPSPDQLRLMVRKLIAERFALKFHHEKKDLSAFVLAVGKNGSKLTPTQLNGTLPGMGFGRGKGGLSINFINGTMGDFTSFVQMVLLDRPVVDQTGLTGKYDFNFVFTPDDSMFNGRSQGPKTDDAEAAPNFFDALQENLGLKLTAEKTAVDVLVIDHVEKPSAN